MAQITNKRIGELVQALFRILEKQPEGMKAKEALAALANSVTLTDYEAGSYESGRRFEKIVRFATVDTVRAGWLIKESGVWTLTEEGAEALKLYKDPLEFHKKAAQIYQHWLKNHKKSNPTADSFQHSSKKTALKTKATRASAFLMRKLKSRPRTKLTLSCMPWSLMNFRGWLPTYSKPSAIM